MAIEFNCPYCTATVRVADTAAGKIGRCPKCDTRVRIPVPTVPQLPASPSVPRPPSAHELPVFSIEAASQSTDLPDLSFQPKPINPGQLPVVSPTDDPVTSKYLKKRRRKGVNWGALFPPLFFGSIFVAIGLFFYFRTLPSYEATLEGERLNPNQNIRVELKGTTFNIDQKVFSQIMDELRERPSAVRSSLVNLQFQAGPEGIDLGLRPGNGSDLIKVPIMQVPAVASFYQDHLDELDDARIAEMQAGLVSLCEEWAVAPEGTKNDTLPKYRNSVVYNAFVKGLGRICFAQVNGNIEYPCVHEDSDGNLYFLVPVGTKSFAIEERDGLEGTPFFPSKLHIDVIMARPKVEDAEMVPLEPEEVEPIPMQDDDGSDMTRTDGEVTGEYKLPGMATDE